jgi:excisionase family DNA binding protein
MSTPTALYRLFGDDDALLYIGVAKTFGVRWHQHEQSQPWWPEVRRQTIDWHPDREDAEDAERAAIKAERPKYNVVHNGAPVKIRPGPSYDYWADKPLLCSYQRAAERLGVSVSELRRLVADGDLRAISLGPKMRRFVVAELEEYIRRKATEFKQGAA